MSTCWTAPAAAIRDYAVGTEIDWRETAQDGAVPEAGHATVRIAFDFLDGATTPVTVTLLNEYNETLAMVQAEPTDAADSPAPARPTADGDDTDYAGSDFVARATATFIVDDPHLWSAETPYLYTVAIETAGETIVDHIGIREISTEGGVLRVNRQRVTLHGVNRHDSDPVTGPVIAQEQIMRDLKLMKEHNVNAIRTSHYPNAPHFYDLYDRLGFYVVGEADDESHGASCVVAPDMSERAALERWNRMISDNPEFTDATVDRARRCVERDKNRPSIIMWSMGNECAYGCTFEAALAWTKRFDPSRPTHYESARYAGRRQDLRLLEPGRAQPHVPHVGVDRTVLLRRGSAGRRVQRRRRRERHQAVRAVRVLPCDGQRSGRSGGLLRADPAV